jgi:hypothetical protein
MNNPRLHLEGRVSATLPRGEAEHDRAWHDSNNYLKGGPQPHFELIVDPDNGFPKGAIFSNADINYGKHEWLVGTRFKHTRTGTEYEITENNHGRVVRRLQL